MSSECSITLHQCCSASNLEQGCPSITSRSHTASRSNDEGRTPTALDRSAIHGSQDSLEYTAEYLDNPLLARKPHSNKRTRQAAGHLRSNHDDDNDKEQLINHLANTDTPRKRSLTSSDRLQRGSPTSPLRLQRRAHSAPSSPPELKNRVSPVAGPLLFKIVPPPSSTSTRPVLSLNTAATATTNMAYTSTAIPSSSSSSSSSTRRIVRPPPLLLPNSASALSSPSSLSLSANGSNTLPSPITPSFSSRRQRNAKQLSLLVPASLSSSSSTLLPDGKLSNGSHPLTSISQRTVLAPPPRTPNLRLDSDSLHDLSETRSCPPTPRLFIDTDKDEEEAIRPEDRGQLKSSLQGEMSMRRRSSLPRLNIIAAKPVSSDSDNVPPTPSLSRPKTGIPALTVEALVARNREAGAPVNGSAEEAAEDFPYQCGPKEILPGLYLGSEQNAKDPEILRQLGITQVICCAKEVACPWLADMIIEEDDDLDSIDTMDNSATSGLRTPSESYTDNTSNASTESAAPVHLAPPSTTSTHHQNTQGHNPRSASPSRPMFLRSTASTPNLKGKFPKSGNNVLESSASTSAIQAQDPTPASSLASVPSSNHRTSAAHAGYLHRQFPANRLSGRPAIDYTKLPWGHDEDDIATHFDNYQICELIDKTREKGGRCLVHCQLGVSRSATLMIGYCMRQAFQNRDPDYLVNIKSMHDTYSFVRAKSRWVAPNIGLLAQLVQYERALAAELHPGQPTSMTNSAYYDSQLSLPGQGPGTPDNLSPSSTSGSEMDSRLTTPDASADLLTPPSRQRTAPALNSQRIPSTSPGIVNIHANPVEEQLSPMTAAMRISKPFPAVPRLILERAGFGSAQRKKEHRKTFSADFSKLPLSTS